MDEKEPLYQAAARELQEETSVSPADVSLFQVCVLRCIHNLCEPHQPFLCSSFLAVGSAMAVVVHLVCVCVCRGGVGGP